MYFDGGVHNKRVAIVDLSDKSKIIIWENVNGETSNQLEAIALMKALEYVHDEYGANAENVVIYGDNIGGSHMIEASSTDPIMQKRLERLRHLQRMCKSRLDRFNKPIEVKWVPRKKNLAGHVLEMMYNMDIRLKYRKARKIIWRTIQRTSAN